MWILYFLCLNVSFFVSWENLDSFQLFGIDTRRINIYRMIHPCQYDATIAYMKLADSRLKLLYWSQLFLGWTLMILSQVGVKFDIDPTVNVYHLLNFKYSQKLIVGWSKKEFIKCINTQRILVCHYEDCRSKHILSCCACVKPLYM